MSVNLYDITGEIAQVASLQGWGDVISTFEKSTGPSALLELIDSGESDDPAEVKREIEEFLTTKPKLHESVLKTLDNLAKILGRCEEIAIIK